MNIYSNTQNQSTFNPLFHFPPKFDIYGKEKQSKFKDALTNQPNILKDANAIENPWGCNNIGSTYTNDNNTNKIKTRTELLQQRKAVNIPDISYDLDGDGFVGGRDYVISKRFDIDKDGKLNKQEKDNAIKAVLNNIEDEYVWNLENQGATRPCRILQKRGKIIDLDNFLPLQDTYPRHPLKDIEPNFKTKTELINKRKLDNKKYIEEKNNLLEKHNQCNLNNNEVSNNINTNDLKKTPKYLSKIKEDKVKNAREAAGLLRNSTDIKLIHKGPSLNYVKSPIYKTKNDLKEKYKQENIDLSKVILKKKHINDVERLNLREDEIFEINHHIGDRMTNTKLKEARKIDNVQYNMKVFSKQTIGVHGHELPKFSEDSECKEFWKYKEGYNEHPVYNSRVELLEKQKYWKKNEELKINDHKDYDESKDNLLKVKKDVKLNANKYKNKDENIVTNLNKINHFKNFDPNNPEPIDIFNVKRKHIYRWTTLVNQFSSQKFKNKRYFDSLPGVEEYFNNLKLDSNKIKNEERKKTERKILTKDKNIDNVNLHNKDSLFAKFTQKDNAFISKDKPKAISIKSKGF